ncbi:MAG TPA: ABA4-like family protein [Rhizomicrobium sp.]|nr:ABA4-like family protein [Rhizomicrobium sp.]
MTPELIFTIANNGILIFWLLLIVAPRWRGTSFAVQSVAVPVILGLAYLWLFYRVWIGGEGAPGTNYTTLPGVMALFDTPTGAVMGWIHYLIFDLFVGAWEARDAARRGVPHWIVIPCLIVTLMAGPVGLLLYLAARTVTRRGGFSLEAA